jgi:hypothetical protein
MGRPTAVFGLSRPREEDEPAWLGASAHGRLAQRNRVGDGHGHDTLASSARGNAAAVSGQRPTPAMNEIDGTRTGSVRRWRTQDCDARGERSGEGAGGGARARRLQPWWRAQERSIEPYHSEQDGVAACSEERGGGGVWCAVNRTEVAHRRRNAVAETVVSGGERGRALLPFGFSKRERERERERMRSGVEAEARAWCYGAERARATGVHAVDGVGMWPPRGVTRLRAVGMVRRAREGGGGMRRALGHWRAGRAEARRERGCAREEQGRLWPTGWKWGGGLLNKKSIF